MCTHNNASRIQTQKAKASNHQSQNHSYGKLHYIQRFLNDMNQSKLQCVCRHVNELCFVEFNMFGKLADFKN